MSGPTIGRHAIASVLVPNPDPAKSPLQLGAAASVDDEYPKVRYTVGYQPKPSPSYTAAVELALRHRPDLGRERIGSLLDTLGRTVLDLAMPNPDTTERNPT